MEGKEYLSTLDNRQGKYIPPHIIRHLKERITDQNTLAYLRMTWEDQKSHTTALLNKINHANIEEIVIGFFENVNLLRLQGFVCQRVMLAQQHSTELTAVFSALISVFSPIQG